MEENTSESVDVGSGGSDADVDSILASAEGQRHQGAIPMTEAPQAQPQTPAEFELSINGKTGKYPVDKILKWAEMGYNAPNKIGELNAKNQEWETKAQRLAELEKRYAPVEDYVKANPGWWDHVTQQWQTVQQQQSERVKNDPVLSEIQTVKTKLEEIEQFKNQIAQERIVQQRNTEDQMLRDEIGSIRKLYPNLDFDVPDSDGRTREWRVLEHAQKTGIPSFKAAFLDLYHQDLMKLAEERGKEAVGKELQRNTKLGLLGKTLTPTKELADAKNVKSKSYRDLTNEALAELGIK